MSVCVWVTTRNSKKEKRELVGPGHTPTTRSQWSFYLPKYHDFLKGSLEGVMKAYRKSLQVLHAQPVHTHTQRERERIYPTAVKGERVDQKSGWTTENERLQWVKGGLGRRTQNTFPYQ